MKEVILKPLIHHGAECIGIYFVNDRVLEKIIRRQPGVKWSQTNGCWYIALTERAYTSLRNDLSGKALPDRSLLQQYLEKRKKIQSSLPGQAKAVTANSLQPVPQSPAWQLSGANLTALEKFVQLLKLKSYSESTIRTYRNEFLQLLKLLKLKPAEELSAEDLKRYMVYAMEKEGISENTAHSRLNALKFYYEHVLKKEKFFWEIPRPKKPLLLPKVLNEAELGKMFKAIENLKHKAIVFTAYSAGLRVSEVVALKISNVDSGRMVLFIENAKGKKDRIAGLSPLLLDILRAYLSKSNPRPKTYLFEGEAPGKPYSIRSAQQIFYDAKRKAGIHKEISFHGLRHSFATHLLEKGVDIKYIKEILGHFDIKTTERYTHVAKSKLVNIVSPLDDLFTKGII